VSFRLLHERPGRPLIVGNAWDAGSAVLLQSLGFEALATTSSGFGATLGRRDYAVRARRRSPTRGRSQTRSTSP
jgi:2-methylisocitrate lyase-like PEP mutase family enzyme